MQWLINEMELSEHWSFGGSMLLCIQEDMGSNSGPKTSHSVGLLPFT